eukprot:SAG11_NODE_4641_length_1824_cov_1.761739_1_plen_38_part_10
MTAAAAEICLGDSSDEEEDSAVAPTRERRGSIKQVGAA